ncbi:phage integrase N-terminal SAM-like domain-containing protein [Zoogloea sp.]|uniref:phage integrase N-terminal SAM-like domain-containing protein n=1 Tax=Zoogloea sp. TaxID=49181 RepID=UPI0025F50164|nr:phage integrase N-terminal SAM-like domain-containing protein [Zoogloea sp.]HOY03332.1 tyrosine-type recombinase/integrase [Zoogloea sp.]
MGSCCRIGGGRIPLKARSRGDRRGLTHDLRAVRQFTAYLGLSPDKASTEDLHNYQRYLVDHGISPVSLNAAISGLKFFFDITLNHQELMARMQPVTLRIEQGKGRKDRYVMLSPVLLERLYVWWKVARAQGKMLDGGWLFPGLNPIEPLSTRQLNRAIHAAAEFAQIDKRAPTHVNFSDHAYLTVWRRQSLQRA